MKKILIIYVLLFYLTGCWNYRELNDYAIVTGMAIDYADNKYEVSLLFSSSKKTDKDQDSIITLYSDTGDSIYEAIKKISLSIPKEIYISHLSTVIISDTLARNGVTPVLDYLLREPQSHQNFFIILSKDSKAKDILSVIAPMADYPSQNITSTIKITEQLQGRITNANFNKFISRIIQKGISPISNSIILIGNKDSGTKKEEQENSITSAQTKLDTIGIFKGDKLIDWANIEESIGINMLVGDVKVLYFDLPCNNNKTIITTNKYKINNKVEKNKIVVEITAKGMINEVGCNIDLQDNKVITKLQEEAKDKMKEYAYKAISKAKLLKTDIFGYGNMIYKKYPEYFNNIEDWNEYFPNLDIIVNIDFNLEEKGALEQTIGELEK